jgi:serine/threonine protein kinase
VATVIFGKYEIIKRLAIGGMGEIFLARQVGISGFERLVILKSLLPELAANQKFIEQFLDEARVGATLNHPNIVGIYEVGLWQGVYFIAMEYIRGENLATILDSCVEAKIPIPVGVTSCIIRDAALALDHAHSAKNVHNQELGLVHRDISPQNIMVREDGVTKVVDFGIAKAANRAARTQTGTIKGKLSYMAPEQLKSMSLDGRADQFALGVVFWEMLTRQRLFQGENDAASLVKTLEQPIQRPSEIVPTVPRELETIVMRMLQRNRDLRYERAGTVAQALDAYLGTISRNVRPPEVAAFVKQVVGDRIASHHDDLTPTGDNFLIDLTSREGEAAILLPDGSTARRHLTSLVARRRPLLMALGGLVATAVVLGASMAIVRGRGRHAEGRTLLQSGGEAAVAGNLGSRLGEGQPVEDVALDIRQPVGAKIYIDGALWREPVPTSVVGLRPGPHQVRLELAGQASIEKRVELAVGKPTVVAEPIAAALRLTSRPSRASVRSGQALLGTTPIVLRNLAPDVAHTLRVEKRGYEPETVQVTLADAEKRSLVVELKRATPARAVSLERPEPLLIGDGYLSVNTTPWTQISIDGAPHGSTPLFKLRLPPGSHKLVLVNEQAGVNIARTVLVESDKTTKLDLKVK